MVTHSQSRPDTQKDLPGHCWPQRCQSGLAHWEDGIRVEVPVGNAGAASRLIAVGGEHAADPGPGLNVFLCQRQLPPPPLPQATTEGTLWEAFVGPQFCTSSNPAQRSC